MQAHSKSAGSSFSFSCFFGWSRDFIVGISIFENYYSVSLFIKRKKISNNAVFKKVNTYVGLSSINFILSNCCIKSCKLQHNKSGLYQLQSARIIYDILILFSKLANTSFLRCSVASAYTSIVVEISLCPIIS